MILGGSASTLNLWEFRRALGLHVDAYVQEGCSAWGVRLGTFSPQVVYGDYLKFRLSIRGSKIPNPTKLGPYFGVGLAKSFY